MSEKNSTLHICSRVERAEGALIWAPDICTLCVYVMVDRMKYVVGVKD